jgi:hypothetical protein
MERGDPLMQAQSDSKLLEPPETETSKEQDRQVPTTSVRGWLVVVRNPILVLAALCLIGGWVMGLRYIPEMRVRTDYPNHHAARSLN